MSTRPVIVAPILEMQVNF